MLKSQSAAAFSGNEVVFVMEIALKKGYNKIQQMISGFNDSNGGP